MAKASGDMVVGYMEDAYAKLPSLPVGAREFLVTIVPWLSVIFGLLLVLASLSAFGVLAVFSPFGAYSNGAGFAGSLLLIAVLGIAQGVLMMVAFPALRRKAMRGWTLLFWSEVVGLVGSVISLSVAGVIGALIAFYFLFQIKSYYR